MREIKFRLRDSSDKIVGYEKWYSGCWDTLDHYWKTTPCWLYSTDNEHWTPSYICHRYKDRYTGLKAKGKEIFEGDIRVGTFWGDNKKIVVANIMIWDNGFYWEGPYFPDFVDTEIAGNIHENPELMEAIHE
jgi:hypothetical protein